MSAPPPRAELCASGFMTVSEVAQFLRLSRATVYNLLTSGQLAPSARFGRSRRLPRAVVIAYAAARLTGNGADGGR